MKQTPKPKQQKEADRDIVDTVVQGYAAELPDIDSLTLETICRLIVSGRQLERSAAQTLKRFGFSYTDYDVLAMLRSFGTPFELTPADLLRFTMVTSGAMTACLDRLERSGMISRRESPVDRRVRIIALTSQGKEVIEQAFTLRYAAAESMLNCLNRSEKTQLNRLLHKLQNLDANP